MNMTKRDSALGRAAKRGAALCLAMMLALGSFALAPANVAQAAKKKDDTLKITVSGLKLPGSHATLKKGRSFGLRGTFRVNKGRITSVKAYLSKNGVKRFIYEAKPNRKNFSITATKGTNKKSMNATLKFNRLDVGRWKLNITVQAKYGEETAVYTKTRQFVVGQTLTARNLKYPKNSMTIRQWQKYNLKGVYSVNDGVIDSVKAVLRDDDGNAMSSFYVFDVGKKTFDVFKTEIDGITMNQAITFGDLGPGAYTLTVTVKGNKESKWGKAASHTVKRSFVIVEAPQPIEDDEDLDEDE